LIEEGDTRILIDPSAHEKDHDFGELDAVLYTHEHSDHFDAEMAQTFVEQGIAPVYANASTAKFIKASKTVVNDGQEFSMGGLRIKAIELPHCLMPDGSRGPQNTGYLINNRLFHAGDGKELAGLKAELLAAPITGPDVSMLDVFNFAKQVSAKKLIPIHYDIFGANPELYASFASGKAGAKAFSFPFRVVVLDIGESIEL